MISYHITRFIHATIRENKLIHTINALLENSEGSEVLIDDLITQFKRFLIKNDEEIFETHRLKYMTYLGDFHEHLSEIRELQEKKPVDVDLILLELYELPKKRNNLLSTILIYFYLRNHTRLHGQIIFRTIYLYFLIVSYRNRLDEATRRNIGLLDQKQYVSLEEKTRSIWNRMKRRYRFLGSSEFQTGSFLAIICVFGAISWYATPDAFFLRADVTGAGGNIAFGKVAMDSLLLGRLTDGVNTSIQSFGLQNILIVALCAIIFQSLRTGFTNLFVNSFLTKTFDLLGTALKLLARAVFAVYNYIIYKVATRFMFACIELCIARNIRPGSVLFGIFALVYFMLYTAIISVYLVIGAALFAWTPIWWHIGGAAVLLSILLICGNLHSDVANFRAFMLAVERIMKDLADAKKIEQEKAIVGTVVA